MKRTRITNEITYLEPDSMSNFKSCAGVMVDSGRGCKVMIDTNMGPEDTPAFLAAEQPDLAVLTHYHIDHSVWAPAVFENTRSELFVPAEEERYLTDVDYLLARTGGTYGITDIWADFVIRDTGFREVKRYTLYDGNTDFSDGLIRVLPVATPGHSPGHTSFYFPDEKILFTGDMGMDRFGPWYGWVDCDVKMQIESIFRLRSMDVELVLTSHGGVVKKDIRAAWDRCLVALPARETKIREALEKGKTKEEIVEAGVFFGDKSGVKEPVRTFLYMWDSNMFDHHTALMEEGGVLALFPELAVFRAA